MTVGSRLRILRESRNLSQRALAASSGVNRTYIVQLEGGRVQRPSLDKVAALANGLGVSVEMLSNDATPLHIEAVAHDSATLTESAQVTLIPAPTAAQIAAEVVKQLRDDEPPRFLPAIDPEHDPRLRRPRAVLRLEQRIPASSSWPTADEYPTRLERPDMYELTVRGDCMSPTINDGDTVWIDESKPAQVESVVAVDLQNEWTLKRLRRRNGVWRLSPDNTAYDPIDLAPDTFRILGVVTTVLRKL